MDDMRGQQKERNDMGSMDAKAIEILSKGLQACKRKGTMPSEPSKKARMDVPSSTVPIDATFTIKITVAAEVASATKVPPMAKAPLAVESQVETDPSPQAVPLKASLRRLRKEVYHLKRKVEKMKGELKESKKNYVEASTEIDRLRQAHKKGSMDYIRKKRDLEVKLEEVKDHGSEKAWSLIAKASSLEVELNAAKEKILLLEGSSS
ncbi:hypothetical protein COCNU_scaffold001195G000050 [Cocos nucifera]|nr:hypothetical protein [Cocos nucifera]